MAVGRPHIPLASTGTSVPEATSASPSSSSQHGSWLPLVLREQESKITHLKMQATVFLYNLIFEMISHHFCPILFVRKTLLGAVHSQAKGLTKGHEYRTWYHWDCLRVCWSQIVSLVMLNVRGVGSPSWEYSGCSWMCSSGAQEIIPSHWNVGWRLYLSLQWIAQGPFLSDLLWKLLEVRDEGQGIFESPGHPVRSNTSLLTEWLGGWRVSHNWKVLSLSIWHFLLCHQAGERFSCF